MTEPTLEQALWEATQTDEHSIALEVCELYADLTPLDTACSIKNISPAKFFRIKRNHPDVQRAFMEAKEVQAELRLSEIDRLEDSLLTGELDKDIFSAVIKSKQWSITKLRPDMFGTRTTVDVSGTIEHSPARALAQMTETQLLQLANLSPEGSVDSQEGGVVLEPEVVEATFEEISPAGDKVLDTTSAPSYTNAESGGSGVSENSKSLPDSLGLQNFGGWR